jgi:gluconokinase
MGAEKGFDGLCCRFLRIDYRTLQALPDDTDDALLAWAFAHGRRPNDEEVLIWNAYMAKRGWRDAYTNRLKFRLQEAGMPMDSARTMFDFIDLDENRPLRGSL